MAKKKTEKKLTLRQKVAKKFKTILSAVKKRQADFLSRRPHRSFHRTRKRDYNRSLALPGYWAFTLEVWRTLWGYRRLFGMFLVVYALFGLISVGLMSQDAYAALSDAFFGSGNNPGALKDFGTFTSAFTLFAATIASSLTFQLNTSQQLMGAFLLLMGWLITVWLLRQLFAGNVVRLRDAIYSAGSPIAATIVLVLVIMFQLIPLALALIAYNVAASNGIFADGVEAMVVWTGLLLVALLSLYWITSSLLAMVVITLPGMYPFQALKTAGDLIVGRRLRVMMRLTWLVVGVLPAWAITLIPLIFLQAWIDVDWLPIVPVAALLLSAATILYMASYIYLLYRKIIDDEAPPA